MSDIHPTKTKGIVPYCCTNTKWMSSILGGLVMKQLDKKLLTAVIEFSHMFKVPVPKTNDLFHWWKEALNEMQLHDIKLLHSALSKTDGAGLADYFPEMVNMLEEKFNQLHIMNCINL